MRYILIHRHLEDGILFICKTDINGSEVWLFVFERLWECVIEIMRMRNRMSDRDCIRVRSCVCVRMCACGCSCIGFCVPLSEWRALYCCSIYLSKTTVHEQHNNISGGGFLDVIRHKTPQTCHTHSQSRTSWRVQRSITPQSSPTTKGSAIYIEEATLLVLPPAGTGLSRIDDSGQKSIQHFLHDIGGVQPYMCKTDH